MPYANPAVLRAYKNAHAKRPAQRARKLAWQKQYRARNPERVRAVYRANHQRNRDARNAYSHAYNHAPMVKLLRKLFRSTPEYKKVARLERRAAYKADPAKFKARAAAQRGKLSPAERRAREARRRAKDNLDPCKVASRKRYARRYYLARLTRAGRKPRRLIPPHKRSIELQRYYNNKLAA